MRWRLSIPVRQSRGRIFSQQSACNVKVISPAAPDRVSVCTSLQINDTVILDRDNEKSTLPTSSLAIPPKVVVETLPRPAFKDVRSAKNGAKLGSVLESLC